MYHSQNFSTRPSVNGEYGPGSYALLVAPRCEYSTSVRSCSFVARHTAVRLFTS